MKRSTDPLGSELSGMRAYNRRMILDLIRQSGAIPKAEIARLTGLSAQAASVIVNELLQDRLVRKEPKVRGKIGQPHTPIALNPEGALSIGLKVGRRSLEVALVDFLGSVICQFEETYDAPRRSQVEKILRPMMEAVLARVDDARRARIVGVGIAMPSQIGGWTEEIGLAPSELDDWAEFQIEAAVSAITGLPAQLYNDAMAACAAEMQIGKALTQTCALYVYVGTFIGGGIVLDGRLYAGSQGNAGAIGSMPVADLSFAKARRQLIRCASIAFLEDAMRERDIAIAGSLDKALDEPGASEIVSAWRLAAGEAIAYAITSAASVLDFEAVVIDAMLPHSHVVALTDTTRAALKSADWTGLSPVEIVPGTVGRPARVLGAAILPLVRRFSPDQALLVKRPTPKAASREA
ncbi:MAG: ROK family transcriptional regulator [Alphaproteobacteria bacterium]